MFNERMVQEAQLRREELLLEAQRCRLARRVREQTLSWPDRLLGGAGDLMVAWGTALQKRYHRVEARMALAETSQSGRWEQAL